MAVLVRNRLDFKRRIAAKPAEKNGQPPANLVEADPGSFVDVWGVQAAGISVPEFPDGFLGFPWLDFNHGHCLPHPNTAVTRSRSPFFTSASSDNGSIIAARIAFSSGIPLWMRVAA